MGFFQNLRYTIVWRRTVTSSRTHCIQWVLAFQRRQCTGWKTQSAGAVPVSSVSEEARVAVPLWPADRQSYAAWRPTQTPWDIGRNRRGSACSPADRWCERSRRRRPAVPTTPECGTPDCHRRTTGRTAGCTCPRRRTATRSPNARRAGGRQVLLQRRRRSNRQRRRLRQWTARWRTNLRPTERRRVHRRSPIRQLQSLWRPLCSSRWCAYQFCKKNYNVFN